jgi:dolichol-phosphate mannosyltransferase
VIELGVVIPTLDEAVNLDRLLPRVRSVLDRMRVESCVYVLDGGSTDGTQAVAARHGAVVIRQRGKGYGGALRTAFEEVEAVSILTLDADFSHHPAIIEYLYALRDRADIVIASRYVRGGYAQMPQGRLMLSFVLNTIFRFALDLPVRDMSSGFRLYRRSLLRSFALEHDTYAVLQEVLVKAYCQGYQILEVPFHYRPRLAGSSHARVLRFGLDYLSVLWAMWRLRNSIRSADYDTRAFHSRIPLQRWWQRRRYEIILGFIGDHMSVLDVGCGSTQILNGAPQVVGTDIQASKLRFMRRPARRLVNASLDALPFRSEAFEVVVCSQVIEHVPEREDVFTELVRLVEPGGSLILGTPDYGSWQWPLIERIYDFVQPAGYAEEHITHYTRDRLIARLETLGLEIEACATIWRSELIIHARKRPSSAPDSREEEDVVSEVRQSSGL